MKLETKEIWVLCETKDNAVIMPSLELITKASELADKAGWLVCAFAADIDSASIALMESAGADKILICGMGLGERFYDDIFAKTAAHYATKYKPEIILTAATVKGRSIAPQVAMMLKTGLTADCTGLELNEKGILLQTRPAYCGNLIAEIVCERHRPQMASVRPGVFAFSRRTHNKLNDKDIVYLECIEKNDKRIEVIKREYIKQEKININNAKVIVAGGRGIGSKEGFDKLKNLAAMLGGTVGASRGAVNADYAPHHMQIGQTGSTVRPEIYIACGISGSVQHMAGMSTSGYIVAINNDRKAPIFDICDYGIVGDWEMAVDKLIEALVKM